MSEKKKRRRWTASDKLRVVLAGLDGSVEISELCRREGINPTQYYGWKKQLLTSAAKVFADARQAKALAPEPARPVQAYEATDEEKRAVRTYALKHPGIRHRELAWRMVDEGVAYLSPSTVYRILKGENLVCPWRRRTKRTREEEEKARRPDEIWATDLMYVVIGA